MILLKIILLSHQKPNIHRCGYHTNKERGFISTPNFPLPYPVPIICQWIIEAPPNCKIAVYFTQFYLKTGFSASEFAHYMADIGLGVGKSNYGTISSRDEPTYLISNQRILILDLQVFSLDNVHLRVTEHFLETYGFNITYEVIRKNESVRQDGCIYHHCSFTGFCLASADLQEYKCDCIVGYFGEECQYDEDCGPTATSNVCYNGGTCRYYIGSSVRTCECPLGFEGAKCEKKSLPRNETLGSEHKCEEMHYMSHPDYIAIYPDDKKCPPRGKRLLIVSADINVTFSKTPTLKTNDFKEAFENVISEQIASVLSEVDSVAAKAISGNSTEIRIIVENDNLENKTTLLKHLKNVENNVFKVQMSAIELQVKSVLFIERMEISEKMPVVEGMPLIIACIVRGGPDTKVKWLKDNATIAFPRVHGRLWKSIIPKNSHNSISFLLGFDKTNILDSGEFTCIADDETGSDRFTIPLSVRQLSKPLLTPLSATIRAGDSLTITCVSQDVHNDKEVSYFWSRNDGPLLREKEKVEDLFPSGSRIILTEASASACYACAIHSSFGITKETSWITVVSDKEFTSSTCHRDTQFGISWKLSAAGSEDIHLCPRNHTGYVSRRCFKAPNGSAVWQEPDFSKCLSPLFLKIANEFESYKMGYRVHTLNTLLKKMLTSLAETIKSLHLSEAEPLVDILSSVNAAFYIKDDNIENWKVILNITALLLNSSSVSREQSKQKMYFLIRNISLVFGQWYISDNSSREFVSPTLIVKTWKIQSEREKVLFFPEKNSSWFSDSVQLNIRNLSDFDGNISVTIVLIVYRSFMYIGNEEFLQSHTVLARGKDIQPVIFTEANCDICRRDVRLDVLINYKDVAKFQRKSGNISCYKISVLERNKRIEQNETCAKLKKIQSDVVCHCSSSGQLGFLLLEKEFKQETESSTSREYKILQVIGAVTTIAFLIYTVGIFSYKRKFSFLFE